MINRVSASPLAKRVLHAGSRTLGRLTGHARILPSFLIMGGQRCGTTSMYRALAQHPAVLKAVWHKGVHYFDTGYHRGPQWYRGHFPLRRTALAAGRRTGVNPVTFESSPYYLYHPLAPERIAHDLPDVRLIVMVRDPVERASSQHAHEVARGFEPISDLTHALSLERSRLAGEATRLRREPRYVSHSHRHHGYRERGQYIDYLEQLSSLFGRERIHVVDSAVFFAAPERVYAGVLRFLELPELGSPVFERHNARPRAPMPADVRSALDAHFRPYDTRLATWLGSLPSWRQ